LPAKEQHSLATEAGHLSPILIGFDIARELLSHTVLPIRGKAYFLPCFAAVAEKTTRFASICTAIRTLPAIDSYPSILTGLAAIETYLATKPADWSNGARYLSTDFLSPDKARLKIYLRCPSISFDDIWDYFTLGGRIPGLDEDREKYLDFIKFLGGTTPGDFGNTSDSHAIETDNRRKLTTLYFSLDNRYPVPSPKVAFCARNFAANDAVVAHGLDSWLMKYGWTDKGGTSVEDQVANVFTHRALSEKPGIFTFMGLARKDPATRELSIQTYMCPELYESPKRLEVAEDIEDRKSGDRNLA
jgi:DMATS type aromatic prenyltransferase